MAMRTLAIVGTALALFALTGCTAFQPVALKHEPDGLHISICQSFAGDQLEVDSVDRQSHVTTIWTAKGAFQVATKAEYVFGTPPTGMSSVVGPKVVSSASQYIDVYFRDSASQDQMAGHFRVKDMKSDSWLHSDGSHTSSPCA